MKEYPSWPSFFGNGYRFFWSIHLILEQYIAEGKSNLQRTAMMSRWLPPYTIQVYFFPQVSWNAAYTLASGGRKDYHSGGRFDEPGLCHAESVNGHRPVSEIENSTTNFLPNNFHDTKIRVIQRCSVQAFIMDTKHKELITVQQAQKMFTNGAFSINELNIFILESTRKFLIE